MMKGSASNKPFLNDKWRERERGERREERGEREHTIAWNVKQIVISLSYFNVLIFIAFSDCDEVPVLILFLCSQTVLS